MQAGVPDFAKRILLSNLGPPCFVYLEQEAEFTELLHLACLKTVFGVQISKQNSISVQISVRQVGRFLTVVHPHEKHRALASRK